MTMRIWFGAVLATAAVIGAVAGCGGRENADRAPAVNPGTKEQTMGESTGNPVVVIETSMGTIQAELWADKAPKTVENFLRYADEGFYDGLIFHRVIPGFMVQGGGFAPGMREKATHSPVVNEARPELRNDRGTLAMARTSEPNSATAQFFINLVDNDFLNQRNRSAEGFGYCAFGKVVEGLDVVDKVAGVKTGTSGHFEDVPVEAVVIQSIRRAE